VNIYVINDGSGTYPHTDNPSIPKNTARKRDRVRPAISLDSISGATVSQNKASGNAEFGNQRLRASRGGTISKKHTTDHQHRRAASYLSGDGSATASSTSATISTNKASNNGDVGIHADLGTAKPTRSTANQGHRQRRRVRHVFDDTSPAAQRHGRHRETSGRRTYCSNHAASSPLGLC